MKSKNTIITNSKVEKLVDEMKKCIQSSLSMKKGEMDYHTGERIFSI